MDRAGLLRALLVERHLPVPKPDPAACLYGPTRQWMNAQAMAEFFADDSSTDVVGEYFSAGSLAVDDEA